MDDDLKTKLLWVGGGVLGMGAVWMIYSQLSKKGEAGLPGIPSLPSIRNPVIKKNTFIDQFIDRNDLKWSVSMTGVGKDWEWTATYAEEKDNPYYKKKSFSGSSTSKDAAFKAAGRAIDEAVDPMKIALPF